jgi:hypothetical protein
VATWQADFSLVISRPWPPDYAGRLDAVALRCRQLLPSTTTWGSEDGNRLDVFVKDGRPSEGLLRLDLRDWDAGFATSILALLREWSCGLVGPGERRVEPVLGDVALAARGSPAFRFVQDTEAFFRRLQLGGIEDV